MSTPAHTREESVPHKLRHFLFTWLKTPVEDELYAPPSRPFTPAADDADTDDTAFADYDPNDVTCCDECDGVYTPRR